VRIAKIGPLENERIAALEEYDALDAQLDARAELGLKEITDLAARLFNVPMALITLVDRTRQTFVAATGTDICGTDRDVSFCSHAIAINDLLIVPDATLDPRFAGNPLVTGEIGIRFYAGAPLRSPTGHVLGTLCLLDTRPRTGLSAQQRRDLKSLAVLTLEKLENRRLQVARDAGLIRFQNIAATSPDAIVCADQHGKITFWNATAEHLFGFSAEEAIGANLDIIVPQHLRGGHDGGLERVVAGGEPRLVGKMIEVDALHKDGHHFPVELSLSMWREGGAASFGAIMRDLTERRTNEDRLFYLAHHDTLTELPNRAVLFERIGAAIARHEPVHLLLADLDGFKRVNDTLGHRGGDMLLTQVAGRLLNAVDNTATVARLGGDEFAILITGEAGAGEIDQMGDCIIAALAAPFPIQAHSVQVGVSIGVASFPAHGNKAEELVSNADLALYQAKREGRRCRRTFTNRLREAMMKRRAHEHELRQALDRNEFELFYQPQVSLYGERVTGAEALIRWRHPARGLIGPGDFLEAVEEALLAADLGTWALETACAQAVAWRRQFPGFQMGVNLFEAQFANGSLVAQVRSILDRTGLPPSALELEVTENTILRHDGTMLEALEALHAEGVGVAFDDFGTGYASLSMLKAYPLSRLKIDRSFVSCAGVHRADALIVKAVAALGSGLGIDVIAEGIETQAQCEFVRAAGCHSGQGFLFGRPMPASAFERWAAERDHTMPLQAAG